MLLVARGEVHPECKCSTHIGEGPRRTHLLLSLTRACRSADSTSMWSLPPGGGGGWAPSGMECVHARGWRVSPSPPGTEEVAHRVQAGRAPHAAQGPYAYAQWNAPRPGNSAPPSFPLILWISRAWDHLSLRESRHTCVECDVKCLDEVEHAGRSLRRGAGNAQAS